MRPELSDLLKYRTHCTLKDQSLDSLKIQSKQLTPFETKSTLYTNERRKFTCVRPLTCRIFPWTLNDNMSLLADSKRLTPNAEIVFVYMLELLELNKSNKKKNRHFSWFQSKYSSQFSWDPDVFALTSVAVFGE